MISMRRPAARAGLAIRDGIEARLNNKNPQQGGRWWGGISLAELSLFTFLVSGFVVFIAAWLAFHLLTAQSIRYERLRNQAEADGIVQQVNSMVHQHTAAVEALTHDPRLVRLLAGDRLPAANNDDIELGALFPEALRVVALRPGAMGLDVGVFPRLGAEDLDLIQRSDRQSEPLPLEAHLSGSPLQHFDIVRPVRGVEKRIIGHLLVSFDKSFLQRALDQAALFGGYVEIRQQGGLEGDRVLAVRGNASIQGGRPPIIVPVGGSRWQVAFWPEKARGETSAPDTMMYWSIFASALLLMALIAFFFNKVLTLLVRGDLSTLIAAARDPQGKTGSAIGLHDFKGAFNALSKQTTLPVPAQEKRTAASGAVDMIEAAGLRLSEIDDVMRIFDKQKSIKAITKQRKGSVMVPASIFRAYDIRGVVGQTLTAEIVYEIGRAIGSEAYARGSQSVIVARDGRLSGPDFVQALGNGLRDSGRDVIDIGCVPTPVLYYATHYLSTNSGVMVTGSHNPADYNGFKIVLRGETLAEAAIQGLRQRIETGDLTTGHGSYRTIDIVSDYIERITSDIRLTRPLRVVVDCGNGVAGEIAPRLLRTLGCEVTELYCEIDGHFPNHHPDPSHPENLADLIETVRQQRADIGLAFDGDGDRLGVVTVEGKIIWADRQMMLYARDVLSRNPGAEIIFDIKCSTHLARVIREAGGTPLMWKTGHSLVKAKMKETGAPLAGEMSGHIFFKERWFGFDDGLYTAARLLEILSHDSRPPAEVFAELPDAVSTPELNIRLQEGEQQPFVARLRELASFPGAQLTTIDGLRADFPDGWGLVRASNTTPSLVLRFEADTPEALKRIQEQFRSLLLAVKSDVALPF